MGKKVATVITDLFEDIEYFSPEEEMGNEGHDVITIGPEGGKQIEGKKGEKITVDKGIDDVNPEDFDALFIPGGYSPDKLRKDERFLKFVQYFDKSEKPIFTICHGPQLLI